MIVNVHIKSVSAKIYKTLSSDTRRPRVDKIAQHGSEVNSCIPSYSASVSTAPLHNYQQIMKTITNTCMLLSARPIAFVILLSGENEMKKKSIKIEVFFPRFST